MQATELQSRVLAPRLLELAGAVRPNAEALAAEFLAIREVFGDLGKNDSFRAMVTRKLSEIYANGALAAAEATG